MDNSEQYVKIISSIVGVAAYQVPGVASLSGDAGAQLVSLNSRGGKKSVQVFLFDDGTATIDISLNAYYGYRIPDLAYDVQSKIKQEVEKATSIKVKAVNINVVGVIFPS